MSKETETPPKKSIRERAVELEGLITNKAKEFQQRPPLTAKDLGIEPGSVKEMQTKIGDKISTRINEVQKIMDEVPAQLDRVNSSEPKSWLTIEECTKKMVSAWERFKEFIRSLGDKVVKAWQGFIDAMSKGLEWIKDGWKKHVQPYLNEIGESIKEGVKSLVSIMKKWCSAVGNFIKNTVVPALKEAGIEIKKTLQSWVKPKAPIETGKIKRTSI